jgi:predicted nucleotidyltransferase component of viral defense system
VTTLLTTVEILDEAQDRTGLTREQLLLMVAKSGLVRHLATGPDAQRFVLKGGTLLHHVYRSPRQSIRDADYTYIGDAPLTGPKLEDALRIEGQDGFYLNPEDAVLTTENEMYTLKRMPFSIDAEGIELGPRRGRGLDITVSVREGERLDPPDSPLMYSDPLLAGESRFAINGLTLEELSAEKILGWVSREHVRHYIDLAYVARGFDDIDRDRTCNLVSAKFEAEKDNRLYREKGVRTVADLVEAFSSEQALAALRKGWEQTLGTEIFFLPSERDLPADERLAAMENVERYVTEFWLPALEASIDGT